MPHTDQPGLGKCFTRLSFIPSLPLPILSKKHYLHLLDIRYKGGFEGKPVTESCFSHLAPYLTFLKLKNNLNNPHS